MLGWKKRNKTDYIVIHCSKTHPDQQVDFRYLEKRHREQGALSCGYHWVIHRDGAAVTLRGLETPGNHCYGLNGNSVAICLIGGVNEKNEPESNYTKDQWKTLRQLIDSLKLLYPDAEIVGHRDVSPRENICPSFDVRHWVSDNNYQRRQKESHESETTDIKTPLYEGQSNQTDNGDNPL